MKTTSDAFPGKNIAKKYGMNRTFNVGHKVHSETPSKREPTIDGAKVTGTGLSLVTPYHRKTNSVRNSDGSRPSTMQSGRPTTANVANIHNRRKS